MTCLRLLLILAAAGLLSAQTKPRERDLKYEKEPETAVPVPRREVEIPRSYALVVGIANYEKLPPEGQLLFSERDAELMYSTLISTEGGNFKAENVRKLIGSKATLANLRKALEEWLPQVSREDDRVLIYFAGHGFVHGGKAYLAPYDLDPKNVPGTGYAMDTLGKVIGGRIKGKWKVLLTDSCHSGAITPGSDAATINSSLKALDRSLFSLTASRDREQSFESADWGGGHGIFTYYVARGLEGAADESTDGIVTADELGEYVRRNVREATGGKQNPTADRGSYDPQMLLAFVGSEHVGVSLPAPKNGTLIFEANMDGVEVFLDGSSVGVVNKKEPLRLPGLVPGTHTIKGVRMGYEPDGPREEIVYPGQESTISIKILIPRQRKKAAVEAFDKGLEEYNKGSPDHYRKAAVHFRGALSEDPKYSHAALYLARSYNALYENESAKEFYQRAIEIDPDYLEARSSYGGMLLDLGDLDESIRQLNTVVQRDSKNALAWTLLAQALCRKELYNDSIEAAHKSIKLNPHNAESHLWLGESLRLNRDYGNSIVAYNEYLSRSDYDSKLAGKLNYYVLGFLTGTGKKKRANLRDIWQEMRSIAHLGLCDSQRRLSEFDAAVENCRQALRYTPGDAFVHYALGLAYIRKAQQTGSLETLATSGKHFRAMLDLNADLEEAVYAKQNLLAIDAALAK